MLCATRAELRPEVIDARVLLTCDIIGTYKLTTHLRPSVASMAARDGRSNRMLAFNRLFRCFFLFSMVSLWFGGQARAAISLIQHNGADIANATSGSLPFLTNNSGGNWIAVCVRAGRSNEVFTVSDSRGNTYRQAAQFNDTLDAPNGNTIAIFYAENIAAGANTVAVSDTISATLRVAILEYSGLATTNSLDVAAAAQGNNTAPNSGSATTTADGDLLLTFVATADAEYFNTPTGWKSEPSCRWSLVAS